MLSFMVQPFHEAFAAEDIIPEPEPTPVAESVKEQVEEVEELEVEIEEVTEEPESEDEEEVLVETDTESEDQDNEELPESDTSEDVGDENAVEVEEVDDDVEESNDEDQSEDEEVTEDDAVLDESESDDSSDETNDTSTSTDDGTVIGEETASTTEDGSETVSSSTPATGGSGGGGSSSNADNDSNSESGNNSDSDTETDEQNTNTSEETTSTSTDNGADQSDEEETQEELVTTEDTPVVEAEILINEDNFYQFSRQSCVAVGDGTYHCSSSDVDSYDTQSVVYAALGESQNMEIFLQTSDGEINQITDNDFDDTSPYYDAETLQVVWQRMIDGRHQIILYDIVTDKESQLTFSRTNNMEPKVSVDGVVWQAWDNNDWEIMYFDGIFTDQITDNQLQDVTPVIKDGYVLWTVIGRSDQEAKVYSLQSGEILTIENHDGGTIENPRFVLVYDTKFDNGDVITQGFDPATGVSEPIAASPAPQPVDIPFSDPTGEIRALIQNKSFSDDELEESLQQYDSGNASSSATTTDGVLDLSSDIETEEVQPDTSDSEEEVFELTEFDLILTEVEINFEELEEIEEIIEIELENSENSNTQE